MGDDGSTEPTTFGAFLFPPLSIRGVINPERKVFSISQASRVTAKPMDEVKDPAAEVADEDGAAAVENKGDEAPAPGGADGAESPDGEEGDDPADGEGGEGDGEGTEDPAEAEDDGAEPPVRSRLTPKDHIIRRLQGKKAKPAAQAADDDGGDDVPDENAAPVSALAAEDKAAIADVVNEQLAPLRRAQEEAEDKAEADQFHTSNPVFAPFRKKIERFWQHPSRRNLPYSTVAYEVAGPELMKLGAKVSKRADVSARANGSAAGGSARTSGGKMTAEQIRSMPNAEFEALQQRVRQGERL